LSLNLNNLSRSFWSLEIVWQRTRAFLWGSGWY